jgi:hypothetical protein
MNRRILEAVAEAIVEKSGYLIPDSSLHKARNPGGLLAFSTSQARDENGYRAFGSVLDGLQALLFDVEIKLAGRSRAHLTPANSLEDFAVSCGQPATAAQAWARFLKRALADEAISAKTQIGYLLEHK